MTEGDYENLADTFLGESISAATYPTIQECVRAANQDILRYNSTTEEFGVLTQAGHIRTYFKPDPAKHGFATNYDYFVSECSKV